jgi:hypothetical protein
MFYFILFLIKAKNIYTRLDYLFNAEKKNLLCLFVNHVGEVYGWGITFLDILFK